MDDVDTHSAGERPNLLGLCAVVGGGLVIVVLGVLSLLLHGGEGHAEHHGAPPMWWLGSLPFVGMLGCIAVLPLVGATHHWWENNLNRLGVAAVSAALTVVYYVIARGLGSVVTVLEHAILAEYIPFIVLLFCLYVISGGISLRGDLAARPLTNTTFLAMGALIASFVGTTGASMLLIRPLLQTNAQRKRVVRSGLGIASVFAFGTGLNRRRKRRGQLGDSSKVVAANMNQGKTPSGNSQPFDR